MKMYATIKNGLFICLVAFLFQNTVLAQATPAKLTKKTGDNADEFLSDSLMKLLRVKNPLSAGVFAGTAFLYDNKGTRELVPGDAVIEKSPDKASYTLFDQIPVKFLNNVLFKTGDTLDIIHSIRSIKHAAKTANLVQRIGVAIVTKVQDKKATVTLIAMSDVITEGDRLKKAEIFYPMSIDTAVLPERHIEGEVLTKVESTVLPYLYQTIVINKGALDGVELGNVFTVYSGAKDGVLKPSIVGLATHVGENSSSLLIIKMFDARAAPGNKAVLISRAILNRESQ